MKTSAIHNNHFASVSNATSPRVISHIPPAQTTLTAMLRASADDVPTGIRLLDRHERENCRSRNDLIKASERVANGLLSLGVAKGERIAVILPTCHEFLEIFFGAQMADTIPTALYPPVRLGRLDEYVAKTVRMLKSIRATKLVTDSRCRKLLGEVVNQAGIEVVTTVDELRTSRANHDLAEPNADDVAFIQFSSGSTRDPAPVMLTHAQVIANIEAICHEIPEEAYLTGGGCVGWLPLYHDMGLIGCMLTCIRCQRDLTLIPPELFLAKPALWIRAMSKYRATVTTAPNFAYARCITHISGEELEGVDLSFWAVAMNGAEPISAQTMRDFYDRFKDYGFRESSLLPVYGMSEASLALSFANEFTTQTFDRDALAKGQAVPATVGIELTSVGHPLAGYTIEVRDDQNQVLPEAQVGMIWGQGPSIMKGYWNAPTHQEPRTKDQEPRTKDQEPRTAWLETGDLGFILNNQLYICGRAKDVLIVAGRNHSPQDVEEAVSALDGIREGCVIAVSDLDSDGENLLVFAEYRDKHEGMAQKCIDAVRAATGLTVDFIALLEPGTLPRTSSGKLRRRIALQRWKSGELTPPDKVTPGFIAGKMLKSYWNLWKSKA